MDVSGGGGGCLVHMAGPGPTSTPTDMQKGKCQHTHGEEAKAGSGPQHHDILASDVTALYSTTSPLHHPQILDLAHIMTTS